MISHWLIRDTVNEKQETFLATHQLRLTVGANSCFVLKKLFLHSEQEEFCGKILVSIMGEGGVIDWKVPCI